MVSLPHLASPSIATASRASTISATSSLSTTDHEAGTDRTIKPLPNRASQPLRFVYGLSGWVATNEPPQFVVPLPTPGVCKPAINKTIPPLPYLTEEQRRARSKRAAITGEDREKGLEYIQKRLRTVYYVDYMERLREHEARYSAPSRSDGTSELEERRRSWMNTILLRENSAPGSTAAASGRSIITDQERAVALSRQSFSSFDDLSAAPTSLRPSQSTQRTSLGPTFFPVSSVNLSSPTSSISTRHLSTISSLPAQLPAYPAFEQDDPDYDSSDSDEDAIFYHLPPAPPKELRDRYMPQMVFQQRDRVVATVADEMVSSQVGEEETMEDIMAQINRELAVREALLQEARRLRIPVEVVGSVLSRYESMIVNEYEGDADESQLGEDDDDEGDGAEGTLDEEPGTHTPFAASRRDSDSASDISDAPSIASLTSVQTSPF